MEHLHTSQTARAPFQYFCFVCGILHIYVIVYLIFIVSDWEELCRCSDELVCFKL